MTLTCLKTSPLVKKIVCRKKNQKEGLKHRNRVKKKVYESKG